MVEPIRYGAGGVPMVNQPKPKKVEVAQKTATTKKDKKSLQEIIHNQKMMMVLMKNIVTE